ncbi:MAG: hypothetical protein IJH55_06510 [Romboutsia sp.]|nr:hypothetical protein [Romboutsia sp.]
MKYLDKDSISSFPSTKRASVNKLMTENSVTRLINRLVDVTGFVITNGLSSVDFLNDIPIDAWSNNGADFEFVIRGYYFSISKGDQISGMAKLISDTGFNPDDESVHTLYAGIFIDKTDSNFPELYGQDDDENEYRAIVFYTGDETRPEPPSGLSNYDFYEFPLVTYKQQENGTWSRVVALDSLFKFNSISIADIDGGEIKL